MAFTQKYELDEGNGNHLKELACTSAHRPKRTIQRIMVSILEKTDVWRLCFV